MWETLGGASGVGTLLGGLGSIYGGYMQGKLGKDMFNLQKENLYYNRDQEKKRTDGLGNIGSYYSGVNPSTAGSMRAGY